MRKGLLAWMMIATILFIVFTIAIFIEFQPNYYIIDKGYTVSHMDEYGFMHDEIFWFILHNKKNDNTIALFVTPLTWYSYSVGHRYGGNVENGLPYINDAEFAKYLEENR